MRKKSIVRLTDAERRQLRGVVGKRKGSSQKVRRARGCCSRRMWTTVRPGRPEDRGVNQPRDSSPHAEINGMTNRKVEDPSGGGR